MKQDNWILRLSLQFKNLDNTLYLSFKNVFGFRLLPESQLLEFWDKDVRAEGFIWTVNRGGWKDLEKCRSCYRDSETDKEYLILGVETCLSVFSSSPPWLTEP